MASSFWNNPNLTALAISLAVLDVGLYVVPGDTLDANAEMESRIDLERNLVILEGKTLATVKVPPKPAEIAATLAAIAVPHGQVFGSPVQPVAPSDWS